ncbi:KTSC domain-containing protein [Methanosphaera stadtmanae]|uniref:KTSC domain-containing protein n=1 Tax=Methanosphaera stadtmanae TaxID=2317 RepID=UPI0039B43F38
MKNIDRIPVESSYINSVGYDIHSSTLEIEFKPDYVVFDYLNVPYSVYVAFMNSSSLGNSSINISNIIIKMFRLSK